MDDLAAAAAAAAAADAAEEAAMEADEDGEEAQGGICVGPEHQADLPFVRPLPAFSAAMALMDLKKSGNKGPDPELALRMAMEVRAYLTAGGFWLARSKPHVCACWLFVSRQHASACLLLTTHLHAS
jgi:hypothetical protein